MAAPIEIALGFVTLLRGAEISVPLTSSVLFSESLSLLDMSNLDEIYWAARATLLLRLSDLDQFNQCFSLYFGIDPAAMSGESVPKRSVTMLIEDEDSSPETEEALSNNEDHTSLRFSAAEVLKQKDFSRLSDEEMREVSRLVRKLKVSPPLRVSLRERNSRSGRSIDMRRTIREIVRYDGEIIKRSYRSKSDMRRKVVVLCDVSGSMEPYARVLIRFAQASLLGAGAEVFTFGTRLTRITRELGGHDFDEALQRATNAVNDWSGGTRIGDTLAQFNGVYGVRGMARGSIVVLLSDGWDRGDPVTMAKEMERLSRVAHKVIWVNPLKAMPGYAPLTRGMSAALPYVDEFLDGHCLDSLEMLAEVISSAGDNRYSSRLETKR